MEACSKSEHYAICLIQGEPILSESEREDVEDCLRSIMT